jgi:hypothetical protein
MAITLNTKAYTFRGFNSQAISQYLNTAAGVARGFLSLTAKVDGGPASETLKVRWKLKLPTLATDATACACPGDSIREIYADIVVSVPASATAAERDDMAKQLKDLTATPEFQASVKDLLAPSA